MPLGIDWLFISKKVLSGLFPQARLLGEALVIAVSTLLPTLPRISLGWAARRQSWMVASATQLRE